MSLTSGTRLGAFEIAGLVGAGGMGEVYRARDTRLDRTVAIKVLSTDAVDASSRRRLERFRQEARAVARITHPNICTLHDVGEDGETTFLVMEFVEGTTLAQRLEQGPLPPALALTIAVQIADALDHAHRHGVVHRDLKPSNIMLSRDRVKLLDFGLAKLAEPDERATVRAATATHLTEAHTIVGTAAYMSPEQIEGRAVDARTDIFAFGVVLYEMLAGRRPFEGDSRMSLLAAIVSADPPPLGTMLPERPALDHVVRRCLAKDPEERWQTARDLGAELRWIAEEGSAVDVAAARTGKRRTKLWLLAGGAAVAGAAAAIVVTTRVVLPPPAVASYGVVTFRHGIVSSARFAGDDTVVYSASWDGEPYDVFLSRPGSADARRLGLQNGRLLSISPSSEMAVLFGQQVISHSYGPRTLARIPIAGGARRDLLDQVVDADWIPGTGDLAAVRQHTDGTAHVEFPIGNTVHKTPAAWSLRVSPDGSRIAFFEGQVLFGDRPEDQITVIDRAGRKSTVARGWAGLGLAWERGGREIWFTATRGPDAPSLHAVSLSGTQRPIHAAADWLVLHDISRDGVVLLSRNTIKWTTMCQAPGESAERDLTWLGGSQVRHLSLDGRILTFSEGLYGRTRLPIVFQRETSGTPAVRLGDGYAEARSPDGRWTLARGDTAWILLPTGAGSSRTLEKAALARVESGRWLPDGRHIVFAGWESAPGSSARIYVQAIDGGPPRAITPDGVSVTPGMPTPNGRAVLGRDMAANEWRLFAIDGGTPRPMPALSGDDVPLQWGADGKSVFARPRAAFPWRTSVDVFRIDLASGRRTLWKTLAPADPEGIDIVGPVVLTPDARAYCYSYMRRLGALFTVEGLR